MLADGGTLSPAVYQNRHNLKYPHWQLVEVENKSELGNTSQEPEDACPHFNTTCPSARPEIGLVILTYRRVRAFFFGKSDRVQVVFRALAPLLVCAALFSPPRVRAVHAFLISATAVLPTPAAF
jgi:hypothetical protein